MAKTTLVYMLGKTGRYVDREPLHSVTRIVEKSSRAFGTYYRRIPDMPERPQAEEALTQDLRNIGSDFLAVKRRLDHRDRAH